jgi:DNA polymerase-3 subunit epsilon
MEESSDKYKCFLDFETTGSNPYLHFPIQIGAVLVREDLSIVERFSSYIRPPGEARNTDIAFRIHHIALSKLRNAPEPKDVINDFFRIFGTEYCFASWNISFDVSFFRKLCNDNNKMKLFDRISYRHIDVQTICSLARKLELIGPKVQSLNDCAAYFDLSRSDAHDAFEDSILVLRVYGELRNILKAACRDYIAAIGNSSTDTVKG